MSLDVRIGTVPILWNNDDVPEVTPPVPYEQVIAEVAAAGFAATELGTNYARDPVTLRADLARHGLVLSGGYFCAEYRDRGTHAAVVAQAERKAKFLKEAGAEYLVVADILHPERVAVAGRAGPQHALADGPFSAMVEVLQQIADVARAQGLKMVFHNHVGTYVETPDELDRLLSACKSSVGLCLDTGHYTFGGGDAVSAVRRYKDRIQYVHLKDVDPQAQGAALRERVGFLDCLRRRVFTELGGGRLDVAGVLGALSANNYKGWLVCEQDTGWLPPLESARRTRQELARNLAKLTS